jgi:hypothetical protein
MKAQAQRMKPVRPPLQRLVPQEELKLALRGDLR